MDPSNISEIDEDGICDYGHIENVLQVFEDDNYCNGTYDSLLCWPSVKAGTKAFLPCPGLIHSVRYDTTKNASKQCFINGTWDGHTDYSQCRPIEQVVVAENLEEKAVQLIYFIGYSISLISVTVALFIFLHFKDLRCLRNTFHTHLMATYFLLALFWIISLYLDGDHLQTSKASCIIWILLYYFQGTNFFWMFVEGFYLYMLVVRTFTVDKVRFGVYIFLGWGLPATAVTIWTIVKYFGNVEEYHYRSSLASLYNDCPWYRKNSIDWIFYAPILLVLAVNMMFLGRIMWVLITKLRAATTAESQQYRKAAKALLVLIPLLGIPYIVVLVAPEQGIAAKIIQYARAISLSTQGFTVSVIYCFLNGEVRNAVGHHLSRWRTSNYLGGLGRSSRYRDGSPKSRTESIRLCSAVTIESRCDNHVTNKDTCVSCLNTQSTSGNDQSEQDLIVNNGSYVTNGICCTSNNVENTV